jgi:hypothetical protein
VRRTFWCRSIGICQWAPKFAYLWAFNFPLLTVKGLPVINRFRDLVVAFLVDGRDALMSAAV